MSVQQGMLDRPQVKNSALWQDMGWGRVPWGGEGMLRLPVSISKWQQSNLSWGLTFIVVSMSRGAELNSSRLHTCFRSQAGPKLVTVYNRAGSRAKSNAPTQPSRRPCRLQSFSLPPPVPHSMTLYILPWSVTKFHAMAAWQMKLNKLGIVKIVF